MPPETDPIASSVWVRPVRSRGASQPTLSREQIVRATVELLDAEGLGGLSMRRLGNRLGAGATSVYWYVANKDDLLELAVDEVMGEIEVPDPAEHGWRAAAATLGRGMHSMVLRHPWIASLLGTRPTIGPHALRLSDRLIKILVAAGFTGADVLHASTLVMSHAFGSASRQVAWQQTTAASGVTTSEVLESFDEYQRGIAGNYPNYDAWWQANKELTADADKLQNDSFEFGLQRLLDGLETWLDRTPGAGGTVPASPGDPAPGKASTSAPPPPSRGSGASGGQDRKLP
jgi:AcrR family transcriptional regulator